MAPIMFSAQPHHSYQWTQCQKGIILSEKSKNITYWNILKVLIGNGQKYFAGNTL